MPKRPLPSNEHAHNEASASASSEMTKKKDILKSKYVGVRAVKDGKRVNTLERIADCRATYYYSRSLIYVIKCPFGWRNLCGLPLLLSSTYSRSNDVCAGWSAVINSTVEGKRFRQLIGPFPTEEEAARKYDEVSAARGRPVNFPAFGPGGAEQKRAKRDAASKFLGGAYGTTSTLAFASLL